MSDITCQHTVFLVDKQHILERAASILGWESRRNEKITYYGGKVSPQSYPLTLTSPECEFSVGFKAELVPVLDANGLPTAQTQDVLQAYYDDWAGNIEAILGKDLGLLKQRYALELAKDELMAMGYSVSEQNVNIDNEDLLQLDATR